MNLTIKTKNHAADPENFRRKFGWLEVGFNFFLNILDLIKIT